MGTVSPNETAQLVTSVGAQERNVDFVETDCTDRADFIWQPTMAYRAIIDFVTKVTWPRPIVCDLSTRSSSCRNVVWSRRRYIANKIQASSIFISEYKIFFRIRIVTSVHILIFYSLFMSCPVAPTSSRGRPWNASFHFSFLMLDSR
jgi:hypothetical protein